VKRATRTKSRIDSLVAAGVSVDSARAIIRRTPDAQSESDTGGEDEGPRRAGPPPRVPNKAGINSFAWNMRYPDASSFPGLIMWAAGTTGPMAPPGTYRVRMSVDGKPVGTETFALKKDPRTKATQADLAAQFAFLEQVRARTSQANDGVKTIRSVRSQVEDREKKLSGSALTQFRALTQPMLVELSSVEDSLYQTKNRSGQDPLNYPIRLNNKIAALAGVAGSAEARPTDQTVAVFKDLSAQLDVQLGRMQRALGALPKINAVLKSAGQPEIVPKVEADPGAGAVSEEETDF
jgi:hypothetical protein